MNRKQAPTEECRVGLNFGAEGGARCGLQIGSDIEFQPCLLAIVYSRAGRVRAYTHAISN